MDVDNSGSDDLQSGRPQDMKRQIQEQTAQMEKLTASVEELKESSSSLRSSPEPTSSESVDNYVPDLSTLSGVNFVKRRQAFVIPGPSFLSSLLRVVLLASTGRQHGCR